ncbi:hypothetical protein [uncultured Flavobacterium sp.]|uniref:hypothetical protein n=1 Tax=uncultured Flavobacterium sp. TaxID=165435 RepID=UPI0030C8D399
MNSEKTNLTKHCELCLNHSINFQKGTFCILTNEKPNFDKKCSKIKFGKNLKEKITEVNVEYKKINNEKILVYIYFIIFIILAIGVFLSTYFFYEYISGILKSYISKSLVLFAIAIITFLSIGIVLLGYAFGMLNKHLFDKKANLKVKSELDSIIDLYDMIYEIDIKIKDRILKPSEVKTNLKITQKPPHFPHQN